MDPEQMPQSAASNWDLHSLHPVVVRHISRYSNCPKISYTKSTDKMSDANSAYPDSIKYFKK